MNKLILIFFLCFICNSQKKAFQTLSFELGINTKTLSTEFNDFYQQKKGFNFRVLSSYYIGDFYLGLKQINFNVTEKSTSNFDSKYLYIGWQFPLLKSNKIDFNLGFHVGSFEMDFLNEAKWYYAKESELSTALQVNFNYQLSKSFYINARTDFQQIYTYKRIYLHTLNIGISYKIETPKWLKRFLH